MTTDESIYRRFVAGDDTALRELMEKYGNALTLYIAGYVHNMQDAEDLMIEAFSYLVFKKPQIRDGGFKPYLYKSARHLALRFAIKMRRHSHFSFDELKEDLEQSDLAQELVSSDAKNHTLHLCMEQLKPDYREALYLIYFEDMSYRETAVVMGKSEKQIDNLVQRGKKSLKGHLEREGITDANY